MLEAIVTDGGLRNVLAGIRGLGRAGVQILVTAERSTAAGMRSRYATERVVLPSVNDDQRRFAAAVSALATARADGLEQPIVVHPGREEAIDALIEHAPASEAWRLPWPAASARLLRQKESLGRLASEAGVRTPRTLAMGTAAELEAEPPKTPSMLKPLGPGGGRVVPAPEPATLARVLSEWPDASESIVVQERVDGTLVSLSVVVDSDGQVVAAFQHRALRTWPEAAGTTSAAIGEAVDDDLLDAATRLLRAASHQGFAQVQFLADAGGAAVIDVNCGFPGSLPLALASGVNLPLTAHRVARSEPVVATRPYRTGLRYRWLEADLMAFVHGRPGALCRAPGSIGAVWARDDPVPSVLLTLDGIIARARRLARVAR